MAKEVMNSDRALANVLNEQGLVMGHKMELANRINLALKGLDTLTEQGK